MKKNYKTHYELWEPMDAGFYERAKAHNIGVSLIYKLPPDTPPSIAREYVILTGAKHALKRFLSAENYVNDKKELDEIILPV